MTYELFLRDLNNDGKMEIVSRNKTMAAAFENGATYRFESLNISRLSGDFH